MSTSRGVKWPWATTPVGQSFRAPASKMNSLACNARYRARTYGETWRVRRDQPGTAYLATNLKTCTVTRIA